MVLLVMVLIVRLTTYPPCLWLNINYVITLIKKKKEGIVEVIYSLRQILQIRYSNVVIFLFPQYKVVNVGREGTIYSSKNMFHNPIKDVTAFFLLMSLASGL